MFKIIRKFKVQIGIVLSMLFLYLALRKVAWAELKSVFSSTSLIVVTGAIVLNLIIRLLIVYRWRLLLSTEKKISPAQVFDYINVGYFINTIIPARAGDFIKALMIAQKNGIGKTTSLATVAVERLFDMIGLGMVFIAAFFFLNIPDYIKKGGFIILFIACLVLIIFIVLSSRSTRLYTYFSIKSKNEKYLWILRRIELVLSYGFVLRKARVLIGVFSATFLIWFFYILMGYIIIENIAPGPFSWPASMMALLIIGVSFVLPSTPGNLGVYQYASVLAFSIFGLHKEAAIVFSLISQIIELLLNILLGLLSMWRLGITGKELLAKRTEE